MQITRRIITKVKLMKEIEILIELLEDKREAIQKMKKISKETTNQIYDIYYASTKENIKTNVFPRQILRVRKKNKETFLAYKTDYYNEDNIWQYSDEYEVKTSDFEKTNKIIELCGFKKIIELNNTKYTFETQKYEIVIEEVLNLGLFLEVEIKNPTQEDPIIQKENIRAFINKLGIITGKELNKGKPELMYEKINQLNG